MLAPGRLVLVVGGSGVGKDTLLSRARAVLSGDDRFVFPRRVITRPADASEEHQSVADAEFDSLRDAGALSLSWLAHGHRYGLPRSLEAEIAAGRIVVCNVSRTMIVAAREKFALITVIAITAPLRVRCERIVHRGREGPEDVARRLARTVEDTSIEPGDITIDNGGAIDDAVTAFVSALRSLQGQ
jgi:phosphonate metabolism protein PhnN/1,5-bisphosphokinase (PRPP-forming)